MVCFELSFGVLCGGAIAFAGQTFRLLRKSFERVFELPRDLAHTFGDCGLRKQLGACVFDLRFGRRRACEFLCVRLFGCAQLGGATIRFLTQPRIFRFVPPGTQAYVANTRLTRDAKSFQPGAPEGTVAQADTSQMGTIGPDGTVVVPLTVKGGPQPADASPRPASPSRSPCTMCSSPPQRSPAPWLHSMTCYWSACSFPRLRAPMLWR